MCTNVGYKHFCVNVILITQSLAFSGVPMVEEKGFPANSECNKAPCIIDIQKVFLDVRLLARKGCFKNALLPAFFNCVFECFSAFFEHFCKITPAYIQLYNVKSCALIKVR